MDFLKQIDHKYWMKKLLNVEFIFFIGIFLFAFYCYWNFDRNKIKINDVDFDQLFKLKPIYQQNPIQNYPYQQNYPLQNYPQNYPYSQNYPQNYLYQQPKKKVNKTEEICRDIFEKIFKKKFPSVRPVFLKNPVTGHNLELDGYCEELKLAFEYDGVQHAEFNKHFHKRPNEFIYQIKKDDFKSKKCKIEGIDLIRIPHYIHKESLEDYIKKEIRRIRPNQLFSN